MATTGYKISASAQNATHYEHTQYATWYASRTSKWYCIAQDSSTSDNAIWVHDLATPGTPGDGGGWTLCQITGGSVVAYCDTRDTAEMQAFWDDANNAVHIYAAHSTPLYQQYTLETDGKWTRTVGGGSSTEALPAGLVAVSSGCSGMVATDASAIPWIVYYQAVTGALEAISRTGAGNWIQNLAVTVDTAPGDAGRSRVAVTRMTVGGAAALLAAYTYCDATPNGKIKIAYRLDSAGLTDAWTVSTGATGVSVDNHIAVRTVLRDGQTTSDIHIVYKADDADHYHIYRDAAGSWTGPTAIITTDRSRPVLSYDSTNQKLYLHYVGDDGGQDGITIHQMSTNALTVSWSAESTLIEGDGITASGTGSFEDPVGPSHDVTAAMSPMVIACNQVGTITWWNEIAIAAAGSAHPRRRLGSVGFNAGSMPSRRRVGSF